MDMRNSMMERSSTISSTGRYSDIDASSEYASIPGEEDATVEESTAMVPAKIVKPVIEDKLFVAVGRKVSESKSTLTWALHNNGGNQICLLHVHQPSQTISVLGGKFPVSSLGQLEVRAHREAERQEMNKILDEYLRICSKAGLQAGKLYIDMDSIEKGVVELVSQYRIGKLVMGGAADGRYSRKMIEPKSKKANYVRAQAPAFCHIWFICKGRLIHTREGIKELAANDVQSVGSNSSRSQLVTLLEENSSNREAYQGQVLYPGTRVLDSVGNGVSMLTPSQSSASRCSTPESIYVGGSYSEFDRSSTRTCSRSSTVSTGSEVAGNSSFSLFPTIRDSEAGTTLVPLPQAGENRHSSLEGAMKDRLYVQLDQAMAEAENSRRQFFEESNRRSRAEKDTMEAMRKAKSAENLFVEELRRRREIEQELAKRNEELENMKNQLDMVLEELRIATDQKSSLESRVSELEEKIASAVELLQNCKKN